jgi:hypothetical protein
MISLDFEVENILNNNYKKIYEIADNEKKISVNDKKKFHFECNIPKF